ncbi:MAG: holo-ACP synthase [Lachnospirales bacterium]
MIVGIGTDIIEINRVLKAVNKKSFLKKVFSEREIEIFGTKPMKLAGNFAAKEAVSKALGTGFRIGAKKIEIFRDDFGKPYVVLEKSEFKIHLSISHSKEDIIAYAICETVEEINENHK